MLSLAVSDIPYLKQVESFNELLNVTGHSSADYTTVPQLNVKMVSALNVLTLNVGLINISLLMTMLIRGEICLGMPGMNKNKKYNLLTLISNKQFSS